jgi:hypothetical protein
MEDKHHSGGSGDRRPFRGGNPGRCPGYFAAFPSASSATG